MIKALMTCAAVVVTAAGASVLGSPAAARSSQLVVTAPPDLVTRHISYADLNLATREGERTLSHRVAFGVNDMCSDGAGGNDGSFNYKNYMVNCSAGAWDQARPQMARAVQRAREIATIGSSSITATALTNTLPK